MLYYLILLFVLTAHTKPNDSSNELPNETKTTLLNAGYTIIFIIFVLVWYYLCKYTIKKILKCCSKMYHKYRRPTDPFKIKKSIDCHLESLLID